MTSHPTDGLRREILANGVTLLVQRRRAAPAMSVVAHLRAGFLDEPDDLVGVSHVLEHMLFKGTPSLGPGELAQRTKALGGSLNAYTAYDRTVYYASAPATALGELIALQADQVQRSLLDADELARELRVIIQEARRKLDTPGAVAGETLHQLLFATHRLRRWRIGVEADLERFTRDDVAGYYASRYVPSRVIVSMVGDVDDETALQCLRSEWGTWVTRSTVIPPAPDETHPPRRSARRLSGDVTRSDLALGWRVPGVLDSDAPALDMAAAMLATGRGSRLSRALRDTGLVNSVGAGAYGVVDAGVFSVGAELDAARIAPALGVIGATLRDMAEHAVGDQEFDRAQTLLRAAVGRRLERYESRAIALADAESHGDVARLDREESDLLAVTPEIVRDIVARWLSPDAMAAIAYLPQDSTVPFDDHVLDAALTVKPTLVDRDVASDDSVVRTSMRRTGPGSVARRPEATAHRRGGSQVYRLALPRTDILAARFGDTGQVSINFYRRRATQETLRKAGLGVLTVRTMARGTDTLDSERLAFAFESMGGFLGASAGADIVGFGVTVLREHVARATALLSDVLCRPRFDAATIETERSLLLDDARAVADDMMRFPMQLVLGAAFDDSGYGAPGLGTPASVVSLTAEDIRGWHKALLHGGRTTVVATGDIDAAELAETIAQALDDESLGSAESSAAGDLSPAPFPTIRPGVRVEHRDRQQSALAMLFPGPGRSSGDRFAAEVWSAIAGGLGGRLFESLRSARSLAYTVMANSWQRRRAGGLLTYIACDPQRLDEARAAMLEELDRFREQPPAAEEVARAVAMLAGHVEMSPQTAGGLASEIADAWLMGDGLVELDDPAGPYRAVTAGMVHALASETLDPARRAEGVVTPAVR